MLIKDPERVAEELSLLWVSCGDRDGLMRISRRFHEDLESMNVPHVWHVSSGGHDFNVWRSDLCRFSTRLFR